MSKDTEKLEELSPLHAIRVETALSRYPIHRLAKHGDIAIDIREKNANGEVSIKWEVNHVSKFGQPGPLAYKLDTLIINRRIENAARPVPRIIRLGSLNDICRELGQSESGKNTNHIKNALRQNAFAAIIAKIVYRLSDGSERILEGDFNRYSVVFTGEKLPNGRKADAVYIVLNDVFINVINGAMTRPLDYDYLKSLPPAPQRFYELLSYQMYAAIKYDRPRAKLLYSELCTYAPLVRQTDWKIVRPQLARLHTQHRQSGYIGKIDCQGTVDSDGNPDWIMLYQPGPKARAEFRAFTKRGGPVILEVESLPDPLPLLSAPEPSPLERELIDRGVTETVAAEVVRQQGDDKIRIQIEVFDWLREIKDKKVSRSPAGYLVKSITTGEKGYAIPEGFVSKAERERREETKREKERLAAEECRRKRQAEAREQQERELISTFWNGLKTADKERLMTEALAHAAPDILTLTKGSMRKFGLQIVRERHIRTLLEAEGKLAPAEE